MILYLIAFIGGVLSFFSPCSGALLPVYFAVTFKDKEKILKATSIFAFGVILVSVPFAAGLSVFLNHISSQSVHLFRILGVALLAIGLFTLIGYNPLSKITRMPHSRGAEKHAGWASLVGMGMAAGLSFGTCTGPILGAIATMSVFSGNAFQSTMLMLTYTLGIILPLFIIALGFNRLQFLQTIFVKGKLFKLHIRDRDYFFHSTNIITSAMFFLIAYLFLLRGGLIGSFIPFGNLFYWEKSLDVQDDMVKFILSV